MVVGPRVAAGCRGALAVQSRCCGLGCGAPPGGRPVWEWPLWGFDERLARRHSVLHGSNRGCPRPRQVLGLSGHGERAPAAVGPGGRPGRGRVASISHECFASGAAAMRAPCSKDAGLARASRSRSTLPDRPGLSTRRARRRRRRSFCHAERRTMQVIGHVRGHVRPRAAVPDAVRVPVLMPCRTARPLVVGTGAANPGLLTPMLTSARTAAGGPSVLDRILGPLSDSASVFDAPARPRTADSPDDVEAPMPMPCLHGPFRSREAQKNLRIRLPNRASFEYHRKHWPSTGDKLRAVYSALSSSESHGLLAAHSTPSHKRSRPIRVTFCITNKDLDCFAIGMLRCVPLKRRVRLPDACAARHLPLPPECDGPSGIQANSWKQTIADADATLSTRSPFTRPATRAPLGGAATAQ